MERQLNEIFRDGDTYLKVVQPEPSPEECYKCHYNGEDCMKPSEIAGRCLGNKREDGIDVVFVKIEKP